MVSEYKYEQLIAESVAQGSRLLQLYPWTESNTDTVKFLY